MNPLLGECKLYLTKKYRLPIYRFEHKKLLDVKTLSEPTWQYADPNPYKPESASHTLRTWAAAADAA